MAGKKKEVTPESENWVAEEEKPKKKRSGAYCKNVGNRYELKIVKELKELTGDNDLSTSRAESKKLDDAKIDIFDPNNSLNFYVQCKATQNVPSIKKINEEVGKTDKPLAIFWNCREKRDINIVSMGEYVILPKNLFYNYLENYYVNNRGMNSKS